MEVWELRDGFGPQHLRPGERPEPEPGRGQVLLRMRAAALNYRDTVVIRGGYGARVTVPLIPVSDGVGEVVAVGAGVGRVRVGDRVAPMFFPDWQGGSPTPGKFSRTLGGPLDGVLCRQMCVDAEAVARVPEHLSDVEAACLPCAALTAWNALISQGQLRPGQSVLIQGTGGVALFAVQFARLAGARVILTSTSDDKLLRARALGVDETINTDREPDWDRRVKELTAGEGCDHVVELGGAATLERSLRAVRIGGTVSLIGVLSGADAHLPLPLVLVRHVRLQGITVGSRDAFEAMAAAMAVHRLRPEVGRVFSFGEVPEAFRYQREGRPFGKVCIAY